MSWGRGPYGGTAWGGSRSGAAPDAGFYVVRAWAETSQSLVVVVSAAATAKSPIGVGDALNRDTWVVQDLDNGFVFTILDIATYAGVANAFQIWLLEPFGGIGDVFRVQTTTLQRDFQQGLISDPNYADFFGAPVAPNAGDQAFALVDLHNPPTPESPAGCLSATSAGDYRLDGEQGLFRKIILRAILWHKDSCFHLIGQDFGEGEQLRLNEKYSGADIVKLKKRTLQQLERQPELKDASVRIVFKEDEELLTMYLDAKLKASGLPVSAQIPVRL